MSPGQLVCNVFKNERPGFDRYRRPRALAGGRLGPGSKWSEQVVVVSLRATKGFARSCAPGAGRRFGAVARCQVGFAEVTSDGDDHYL